MVCQEISERNLTNAVITPLSTTAKALNDPKIQHSQILFERLRQSPWLLLHFGAKFEDKEMVETVLESSADSGLVNTQDEDGNTAVHLAILSNKGKCLQTILFFYPDLSIANHYGETRCISPRNITNGKPFIC
jgi:ankyrin repeat protein